MIIWEIITIILFAVFVQYSDAAGATSSNDEAASASVTKYYGFFQDVHVMIFVGFGFLMTFLRKYSFSSVGFNFLVAALTIQWSMLVHGFFHALWTDHWEKINIDIQNLITSDFAAGAVLISFGAVLGKVSPFQLCLMAILEIIFYTVNEMIGVLEMEAVDMGGSMYVHTFGAYFGLGVSYMFAPKEGAGHKHDASVYHSDMFAMVGTLFLWMFWPSFNGALAGGVAQMRVIVNTVLALSGSCITAFMVSGIMNQGKYGMVEIQNATLAGGVAVGSSADLVITPAGALVVGAVAGLVSTIGFMRLSHYCEHKLGVQDTCGVQNLHGIPGIMGGIGGAISAASAGDSVYAKSLFSARDPTLADPRTASEQGGYQAATLIITLAMAIVGGLITGYILKKTESPKVIFEDVPHWEVPEDYALIASDDSVELKAVNQA